LEIITRRDKARPADGDAAWFGVAVGPAEILALVEASRRRGRRGLSRTSKPTEPAIALRLSDRVTEGRG
jgi:hypothetical protein